MPVIEQIQLVWCFREDAPDTLAQRYRSMALLMIPPTLPRSCQSYLLLEKHTQRTVLPYEKTFF